MKVFKPADADSVDEPQVIKPEVLGEDEPESLRGDSEQSPDFKQIRDAFSVESDSVWDNSLSLADNVSVTLDRIVELPNKEIQKPIAVALALLPSAVLKIAPIVICHGSAGSGKSSLGSLVAAIHGVTVLGSQTTFAALRNSLNASKFDEDNQEKEKHTFLVFDDCKRHTFMDENLFTTFRCGFSRETDVIEIASGESKGKNIRFRTFCPKLFSTVENFPFSAQFEELLRRSFLLRFKKSEAIDREFVDCSDLDLSPLREHFLRKFNSFQGAKEFVITLSSLKNRPRSFNPSQWSISKPVITSLIVNGMMERKEAIDLLREYWETIKPSKSPLALILQSELEWRLRQHQQSIDHIKASQGDKFKDSDFPLEIEPKDLIDVIKKHHSNGEIDEYLTPGLVPSEMNALGWQLLPRSGKTRGLSWQKV